MIARNPDAASTLPYLLRLPIEGGLVLRARSTWPSEARVFCYEGGDDWPDEPDIVERLEVRSCRRRGAAVDLVLARGRNNRSQFVFPQLKGGRPAVFWQTAKTAKAARPGARMPRRRAAEQTDLVIVADARERYAYRFATQQATVERGTLRAGDYAVLDAGGAVVAAVERKRFDNIFAGSRKHAEEYTYRFLGAARAELT